MTATQDFTGSRQYLRYHSGYNASPRLNDNVRDIRTGLERIRRLPGCSGARHSEMLLDRIASGLITLPQEAERWSLLVNWPDLLAQHYWEAFKRLATAVQTQKVLHWQRMREAVENGNLLGLATQSRKLLLEVSHQQSGCQVWIVPVQLGLTRRDQSPNEVRATLHPDEAPIDLLNLLVQLIIHPDRLKSVKDMWLDCAGIVVDTRSGTAPYFCIKNEKGVNRLELRFSSSDAKSPASGSGTFFSYW